MLEVIGSARSIAAAIRRLRRRLAGMTVRGVAISWHGGGAVRGDIVWLRDEAFWWHHDGARRAGRHHLMFGVAPDAPTHSESAACEINLPAAGADRRLAGALVRDSDGTVYLAHSGKIGGGRAGRRRAAFRAFMAGGNWQRVRWPDGQTRELLLIGPLDGPRLARQIGRFVQAVHRYKRQAGDTTLPAAQLAALADGGAPSRRGFAEAGPAFAGGGATDVAALCDRALVLDALAEELMRRGLIGESGEPLFATRRHRPRLIEIETDLGPAVLERSVGRLLLRAAAAGDAARAILVVPEAPAPAALSGLARHGIGVVRYRWRGARPVFAGLDAALG